MIKWEYKTVMVDSKGFAGVKGFDVEKVFNQLGTEGWELVSVIGTADGGTAGKGQAVFKREVA
jgi:hypothetical protein